MSILWLFLTVPWVRLQCVIVVYIHDPIVLTFLKYGIHSIETELYIILDGMTVVILNSKDPSLGINTQ